MSAGQTGHMMGQMGHVHGTDGRQTRGCPAKILYVCWFLLFPLTLHACHPGFLYTTARSVMCACTIGCCYHNLHHGDGNFYLIGEQKNSSMLFCPNIFCTSLGLRTSSRLGYGCPHPNARFADSCPEFLTRTSARMTWDATGYPAENFLFVLFFRS